MACSLVKVWIFFWFLFFHLSMNVFAFGYEDAASGDVFVRNVPRILINEVDFKNKEADWLELFVLDDGNMGRGVDLRGYMFKDDGVFKKIEEEFVVSSGDYVVLKFNSEQKDKFPFLYSKKNGLTSTTEQLVLMDENAVILDAFCWVNNNPSKSELKDFDQIFSSREWLGNGIDSCFPSLGVGANQSVGRRGVVDRNFKDDWILMSVPSLGRKNLLLKFDETKMNGGKVNVIENDDGYILEIVMKGLGNVEKNLKIKNKKRSKSGVGKKNKVKSSYKGDSSDSVFISELMVNPDGKDKGAEWIELVNYGKNDVRLGGWVLDDDKNGGSKPFILTGQVIPAEGVLIVSDVDSKLSLNNSGDSVSLFDFNGNLKDEIVYKNSYEGKSYSRIVVKDNTSVERGNEYNWQWVENVSKGKMNNKYEKITAVVDQSFDGKSPYVIEFKMNGKLIKVNFTESVLSASLASLTFKKGNELELVLSKNGNEYMLQKFKLLQRNQETVELVNSRWNNFHLILGFFCFFLLGVVIWRVYKLLSKLGFIKNSF